MCQLGADATLLGFHEAPADPDLRFADSFVILGDETEQIIVGQMRHFYDLIWLDSSHVYQSKDKLFAVRIGGWRCSEHVARYEASVCRGRAGSSGRCSRKLMSVF